MQQKLEDIVKHLKKGYLLFFGYIPLNMAWYNVRVMVSHQRIRGDVDETLLLIMYLLSTAQVIVFEYFITHELPVNKTIKHLSIVLRLLAVVGFIQIIIYCFGIM